MDLYIKRLETFKGIVRTNLFTDLERQFRIPGNGENIFASQHGQRSIIGYGCGTVIISDFKRMEVVVSFNHGADISAVYTCDRGGSNWECTMEGSAIVDFGATLAVLEEENFILLFPPTDTARNYQQHMTKAMRRA